MMDPFSCLSIATAIAQFIEFGVEVIKRAREIQRTKGTVEELSNFQRDVTQFKVLCTDLRDAHKDSVATVETDGHALPSVAFQCEKLSETVLTILKKFEVPDGTSKLRALKASFSVQIRRSEFEACEKQLMAAQVALCTHILKALGKLLDRLDISAMIRTCNNNSIDSKQSTLMSLLERLEDRDRKKQTYIATKLDSIKADLECLNEQSQRENTTAIAKTVQQLSMEVHNVSKAQYLLSTFRFDAMFAREDEVKENHAQTFKWMFSQDSHFSRWLKHGCGLFWISGKAGSGKSTLMKYLFECPETKTQLKVWAGEDQLVLSRHFFWNVGTSMQKSYRGLLQMLCYDIFRSCPELFPDVCEEKWSSLNAEECLQPFYDKEFAWRENEMVLLIRKIGQLRMRTGRRSVRLCFFIDGLDEYHGDHDQLIRAISDLAGFRNLKICVSSRPWNVFNEAFGELSKTQHMITLQDLTRADITAYVQDRLEQSKGYLNLLKTEPRGSELISEITAKADGVFLWVFLVIRELSKSLANNDDLVTLQRRLRQIPPGLVPYFKYMFDNLDNFYWSDTARIFRSVVVSTYELPLLAMSVIFSTEPLAAQYLRNMKTISLTTDIEKLETILGKRVAGCCGDLLGVRQIKVHFLHRTVRDFLATDDMTTELNTRAGTDFDIDLTICRMTLVSITQVLQSQELFKNPELLVVFCKHARALEIRDDKASAQVYWMFRDLVAGSRLQKFAGDARLQLLACMNVRRELERSIKEMRLVNSTDTLTACAREALMYLVLPDNLDVRADEIIDSHALIWNAVNHDRERRGFQLELLVSLLKSGADPNELWECILPFMCESREECTEYRRTMFLKVSSTLIRAGAQEPDSNIFSPRMRPPRLIEDIRDTESPWADMPLIPPSPRVSPVDSEAAALEAIFGSSDAQWLLGLRQGSLRRFVSISWSWLGG